MPTSTSIADILAAKRPQETTVWLLLEPGLLTERARIVDGLDQARRVDGTVNRKPEAAEWESKLQAVDSRLAESRVGFTFAAVGRRVWSDLLDAHPPRPGNTDDEQAGYNFDTFPPALLAAAAVNPTMTTSEAADLWDGAVFSDGETTRLLAAAVAVNKVPPDVDFTFAATGPAAANTNGEWTTPTTTASPTPSS